MTAFTSDLSVDEMLAVSQAGFEPIRFVMGTCHWHVGWTWTAFLGSQEMAGLTRAMADARHGAMSRVERQLQQLGADGMVGTRVTVRHHGEHAEFVAMGTAVRAVDGSHRWRRPDGRPFTSALSGQDLFLLGKAGYAPRALVLGNGVYHVAVRSLGQWLSGLGANQELENFTTAMYDARELAMERMQDEALAAGADGVVGVDVREGPYGWGAHVIEFLAIGTAVVRTAEVEPEVGLLFDLGR